MDNKTMTIYDISKLIGCNEITIRRKINETFPGLIKNGKKTLLNESQSLEIVKNLKAEIGKQITPRQNVELLKAELKNELKDFAKEIVSETLKQILPLLQNNQPKQIELKQDYYSTLGYMRFKNFDEAVFSQMICYGKEASKISRECNKDVRKIPDERFGTVNSYHISVLEKLFEI
jgi:hypothetical protein